MLLALSSTSATYVRHLLSCHGNLHEEISTGATHTHTLLVTGLTFVRVSLSPAEHPSFIPSLLLTLFPFTVASVFWDDKCHERKYKRGNAIVNWIQRGVQKMRGFFKMTKKKRNSGRETNNGLLLNRWHLGFSDRGRIENQGLSVLSLSAQHRLAPVYI